MKKFRPYIIIELAPYLYSEYGYDINKLLNLLKKYDYKFYDVKNFSEIKNINKFANNISDGSSTNIFLK